MTISREFGSGGRTIGRKAAEQLGIPCYDSELVERTARESGFAPSYVAQAGEDARVSMMGFALASRAFGGTGEDYLWQAQSRVIRELAAKGPCVIVGRCADYILRGRAQCMTVFIHADAALRARRIVEVYGERDIAPEQRVREKDKLRAAYHRFYTDMKWGCAQNYQIALDSGALGIDCCAQLLAQLYAAPRARP